MEQIIRIHHIGLRVRDFKKTEAFYQILGFEPDDRLEGSELVFAMKHPAGILLNFSLATSTNASEKNILMNIPAKQTGYTHMALEISNKGQVEQRLKIAGVKIAESVKRPNGTEFFFLRDPDGNIVELHVPKPD